MRVLVTGCKGQLGNEIKRIVNTGKSEIGGNFSSLGDSRFDFIDIEELDIAVLNDVIKFIKNGKYNAVINCAAYTNVDACEDNVDIAMKANAIGPRNLAIAAHMSNAKLVHVSTDYVFGGVGSTPYVEWDLKNPRSIYGKSKSLGEDYVRNFCSKHFIVRTAWLYGYIGKNFVKTIANIAKDKGSVSVVDDQRGNPTNANDLAHHLLKLVQTDEYGIYHCTGNGECSWYDFAKKIVEYAKIDAEVSPCSTDESARKAKRPAFSGLDNMMLRNTVGDDMRFWEDALKEYISKVEF